jgi:lactate permease
VLGQFPTSQWLRPYLPDIVGALVSFGALLLRVWRAPGQQDQGRRTPGRRMRPPAASAWGA